ncbi:hypothetical protein HK100_008719 [Physocladia obscura]|uniref:Uncharacterized protein n=1 Tax=Physocladia obscura TaxID=109957 RepID=A0AAD5SQ55_9FUNG|nr:hypothetical protein HK100_008719 [Physocladia obscura]
MKQTNNNNINTINNNNNNNNNNSAFFSDSFVSIQSPAYISSASSASLPYRQSLIADPIISSRASLHDNQFIDDSSISITGISNNSIGGSGMGVGIGTTRRAGIRSLRPTSRAISGFDYSVASPSSSMATSTSNWSNRATTLGYSPNSQRPASIISSTSQMHARGMQKIFSGGSGAIVSVDEAGMDSCDSDSIGNISEKIKGTKGINEFGYCMRDPLLEKVGRVGYMAYNFFLSQASLYCTNAKDSSILGGFPIPLHHILQVKWENKKVCITWFYSKPPPKSEPRLTDMEIEFQDLFTTSQWALKLSAAATKGNSEEILAKQAIFFIDQEDKKSCTECLKDLVIPILEAAKKPFDIQLVDSDCERLRAVIDRVDLRHTFKIIDECLFAAAMKAKNHDIRQIKVLQPEMDPIKVALAVLKDPLQYSQFCIMNTIIKHDKGRAIKNKSKK